MCQGLLQAFGCISCIHASKGTSTEEGGLRAQQGIADNTKYSQFYGMLEGNKCF